MNINGSWLKWTSLSPMSIDVNWDKFFFHISDIINGCYLTEQAFWIHYMISNIIITIFIISIFEKLQIKLRISKIEYNINKIPIIQLTKLIYTDLNQIQIIQRKKKRI